MASGAAIVIVTIKQPVATISWTNGRKKGGLYSITSLRTLGFNLFDWIDCRQRAIIRTAVVMA